MSSAVCIIPARGGSVRIPRKNIRMFHGKPIIAYSIRAALLAFGDVWVSTEDEEISDVAMKHGAHVICRSAEWAHGNVGTQAVMRHAAWGVASDKPYVCLYPCAPMVSVQMLRRSVEMLTEDVQYVVPVGEWLTDPGQFYTGTALAFLQDMPLLSPHTRLLPIDPRTAIDINDEDDWKKAERMYADFNNLETA